RFNRVVHSSSVFTWAPSLDSLLREFWELVGLGKCIFLYDQDSGSTALKHLQATKPRWTHSCGLCGSASRRPVRYCHSFATRATRFIGQCVPHRGCGNSGRSNQTVSMRVFVLHRFDVWVHPFTKSHRTW